MQALLSNWIFLSVLASLMYFATTMALLDPKVLQVAVAKPPPKPVYVNVKGPSWEFVNPELEQLINNLKTEMERQKLKREELDKFEKQVQAEHAEVQRLIKELELMQEKFDTNVVKLHSAETPNLKKMAKLYSTMNLETTLKIFRQMDDDMIVKLFGQMKEDEIAPIIEALGQPAEEDARRAVRLTEMYRRMVVENSAD